MLPYPDIEILPTGHSIHKYRDSCYLKWFSHIPTFSWILNGPPEKQTVQIDTICVLPPNLS